MSASASIGILAAVVVAVAAAGSLAGCLAAATPSGQAPGTPPSDAPLPGAALGAPAPKRPTPALLGAGPDGGGRAVPRQESAAGSDGPPAEATERPVPITTGGGVSVKTVSAFECPAGGARPFARWIRSAGAIEPRLAEVGVAQPSRRQAAELPVRWEGGERLLLVSGGSAPHPGYRLAIDSIVRTTGGTLQVDARLVAPAAGGFFPQVLTQPCLIVHLLDSAAQTGRGNDDVELRVEQRPRR